jgi:hypothetical protein
VHSMVQWGLRPRQTEQQGRGVLGSRKGLGFFAALPSDEAEGEHLRELVEHGCCSCDLLGLAACICSCAIC